MNTQKGNIWLIILIIVVIGGGLVLAWPSLFHTAGPVACTMEAKLCSDGSYVSRTGPNCEFAACPIANAGWKTFTDSTVSFQYPEALGTKYISLTDWPPKAQVTNVAFTCKEGGTEINQAGQTTKQTINGHTYCVTKESEGAAGSTYTTYTYAFAEGAKTATLTFVLRFPQCGNYNEPEKGACDAERSAFNIDTVIDRVAQSIKIL